MRSPIPSAGSILAEKYLEIAVRLDPCTFHASAIGARAEIYIRRGDRF
ncbi:MAG: hypothetical protein ABSB35_27520 [Bryobacteraceae bacterium]|jgi:hypothetical protein